MVGAGGGCLSSASLCFVIPVEQEVTQSEQQSAPLRTARSRHAHPRAGPPAQDTTTLLTARLTQEDRENTSSIMGKGCMTATKYFLFLFNLIFFLCGAIIMGFGLWLLLDNQSFIVVLNNSTSVKVGCYILIGVGAFSMLMGFLGCLGAIYEIRCLLGLYFTCLLLILIAQIVAGALIYFQKDVLNDEMSKIVTKVLDNYPGNNSTTEQAWDFIQRNMECCGWTGRLDWNGNMVIINSSQLLFPCSCQNISLASGNFSNSGFCEAQTAEWPVYDVGCAASVESWLLTNIGVVLGICLGVALIELLGMILSICLCRNIHTEDIYTKVPKY